MSGKIVRMVKRIAIAILLVGALGIIGGSFWIMFVIRTLPPPELIESRDVAETTKMYDRTGQVLLYEMHGDEKRTVVPLADIPLALQKAVLVMEDAGFYEHPAFDWRGIARAVLVNLRLREGYLGQGGSTITQQLAKTAFLTPERTFSRKLKELILAIRLEQRYTKDEILERYLNQIPFGSNAYGVEAASQIYFGKPVQGLAVAEIATLAAMTRAPTYYSPWGTHTEELFERKNIVVSRLLAAGFLNKEDAAAATAARPAFARAEISIQAPHFVFAVQEYLDRQYGADFVRRGGLRVVTTLDAKLQKLAERVVKEGGERNEKLYAGHNAALVAQDPKTGQILALVGSRDYFDMEHEGNFNVATQGLRQPGSALKPFVYATAFEKGYTPDTVVFDVETEFDTTGNPTKSYKPKNFDEVFRGPITFREALGRSLNVPGVKALYLAGIPSVLDTLHRFGVSTLTDRHRYGLSLVLGGGEVRLIDLVGAYSVFADDGWRHPQTFILSVAANGRTLEEYRDEKEQVMDAQPIRLVNDILSDIEVRSRLFAPASLTLTVFPNHEVALKTGTTDDFRDAWVVGYTPLIAVGVWAGNNDNAPMERRGGSVLAVVPIWHDFMDEALGGYSLQPFEKPAPVTPAKPVFGGEYIVNYRLGNDVYPQVHDILFYVDRSNPAGPEPEHPENDSQFENWERPAVVWAQSNIPGFSAYNKPLPPGSAAQFSGFLIHQAKKLSIELLRPSNGAFIDQVDQGVDVEANIKSNANIVLTELYINNTLIDSQPASLATTTAQYHRRVEMGLFSIQNRIRIVAKDADGRTESAEAIVFRR